MDKLEKIPAGWSVTNEGSCFELVDAEGKVKSSILYRINHNNSGKAFIEVISVGSGREQGRGHYSILYSGLESFAKSQGIESISGSIAIGNSRSFEVHKHLGFSEVGLANYAGGKERRIHFEKKISI